MVTASWGSKLNDWVKFYASSLFIYGIGVGGEYPMTATAAMESPIGSGRVSSNQDRLHRGRKVTSAFLMQGWGQFFNQVILIIVLQISNKSGNPPYSLLSAQITFRTSFAVTAIGTLWLIYYRIYKMPLASKQLNIAKKRAKVTGYDIQSLKLTFKYFTPRLIGTSGTWFCNDVFFYGNKLFQSKFIDVLSPEAVAAGNIMTGWKYNMANTTVSLIGYYFASFFIDNKSVGRKLLMQVGFLMDFILFIIPAYNYTLFTSVEHIKAFQAMYFLSSFFNQFGPNSVTFLIAAEVYPTSIRATAHGFSAACGKAGALLASVLFNYISDQVKFYVTPWFGLVGMVKTWLFVPDTTGLDLREQERWFSYVTAGRGYEYHGVAVHPRHLSVWERWTGVGRQYNPELDRISKINELRAEWEALQAARARKEDGLANQADDLEFPEEVHNYFLRTSRPRVNSSSSGVIVDKVESN